MKRSETPGDFHVRHGRTYAEAGQFNVYKVDAFADRVSLPPNRRDFYKISLIVKCEGLLSYADKVIHVKNNALSFANPHLPYAWKALSDKQTGYFCMFTEDFITASLKTESLADSPLFNINRQPVLSLNKKSMALLTHFYEQMLVEIQSPYPHKYDILRSYVQLILHEALKLDPAENPLPAGHSPRRISSLFLNLLEQQFPIGALGQTLALKTPGEFASALAVHTNHLNRSLKEITGKTTSVLIADRVVKEAKALLLHSDWDIAAIGYCLGFEHPSNFNIFFKKQTGQTPNHFRQHRIVRA